MSHNKWSVIISTRGGATVVITEWSWTENRMRGERKAEAVMTRVKGNNREEGVGGRDVNNWIKIFHMVIAITSNNNNWNIEWVKE